MPRHIFTRLTNEVSNIVENEGIVTPQTYVLKSAVCISNRVYGWQAAKESLNH